MSALAIAHMFVGLGLTASGRLVVRRAGEVDRARKLMQQAHQLLPGSESIRINWEAIQQFKLGTGKPFKGTIVW